MAKNGKNSGKNGKDPDELILKWMFIIGGIFTLIYGIIIFVYI